MRQNFLLCIFLKYNTCMRNRVDKTGMGSRVEHIILERTVGLMLEIMEVNRRWPRCPITRPCCWE
jgi:hypothetical protein